MFKVIIVDDEPYVLKNLPNLVDWNSYGFEISALFQNGNDALSYIDKFQPDVIFTDISMPSLNGLELAKICSEKYPDILIVFFSAHRDFEFARQALLYNVFEYIVKPISYNTLINTLNRLSLRLKGEKKLIQEDFSVTESTHKKNIAMVNSFLEENYANQISLDDAAKIVCMVPAYFSVYYKKQAGINFNQALKNLRMKKSKEFLKNPNIKISHIHEMVGYNSYSHFTKSFQAFYGVTPSEYRNLYLRGEED